MYKEIEWTFCVLRMPNAKKLNIENKKIILFLPYLISEHPKEFLSQPHLDSGIKI